MSQMSVAPAPRRDAQHNRAHILRVARQAFDAGGIDVSMDAVAKLAGVGPGTLYRHFPSKEALLAALLVLHYDELDRRRAVIEADGRDAGRVLERWIEALGDWMLAFEGLPEPLRSACKEESPLTPTCHVVIETTERLLKAAQDTGLARRTVTGRNIFLGALAVAWASEAVKADQNTGDALRNVLQSGWAQPA